MSSIAAKIIAVHRSFEAQRIPHAFGGALALAWCTAQARGTIDIDVNVFVDSSRAAQVLAALPDGVAWAAADEAALLRDGQVRVWWETTPIDLFFNTAKFHEDAALRALSQRFDGVDVPFLSCTDLAVFKAFFNRTKDWADIEAMIEMNTLDVERVIGVLTRYLGGDDDRVARFITLL